MDWLTGMQNVINYIEDHLTEEIDYNEAAKQVACSSFYLQKIFSIVFDMTLGDYIRNRRLSLAGNELSVSQSKVIDVALKYGYESPESFSRAFSKFHGITPSEAKKDGSKLKFFPRFYVKITLGKGTVMGYKILEKEAFYIVEKSEQQRRDDSISVPSIQDFWERSYNDGTVGTLFDITSDKKRILGICYGNMSHETDMFNYSVAAICDKETIAPEGFRKSEIPARTWAVFECIGPIPDAMQGMWETIVAEFFPSSGYSPTYEMDIEIYTVGDRKSPDYRSEIWVPIKKK